MGVVWYGPIVEAAANQAAIKALQMTAEVIKGISVEKAPLDQGPLRNSATVTNRPKGAEISYSTPYAVVMHEKQNYTPSHPGTGPNYLRQPVLDNIDMVVNNVAKAVKATF